MTVDTRLRIGDDVVLQGIDYRLTGLDGDVALLSAAGEPPVAIKVGALFADESFKVTNKRVGRRRVSDPSLLFDSLPPEIQTKARQLERHITEILDGSPTDAPAEHVPNPAYSVRRSLRQRELAKLAELQEQGETVSISSLQRIRLAFEKQRILGLVDQRTIRPTQVTGQTDQRVVDALISVLEANTDPSSGTMDRLIRQVRKQLDAQHGDGTVPVPSRATRCALERTGTLRVEIYTTHDQVLCPRHRLWTGEGVHGPTEQLSIQAAPEVLAAWHHHKNLVTRFGRSGVRKAFHIAGIINWRWYDQFHHFTPALDTYDALAGNQPRNANSHAAVAAALYPSVVALAAIMASPYWARIAHSGRPAQFLERVTSEVTDGWAPTGAADTLRFWMNEDWLPGFRGSDRLPGKVSPESPVQLGQFRVSSVS